MAPNATYIRNMNTFGDISQRDIYLRDKHQTATDTYVDNYFYHYNDGTSTATNTAVERVLFNGDNSSTWSLFTKPESGNLDASGAATIDAADAKTTIRSTVTELTGTLDVSGAAALKSTLDVSGAATLQNTLYVAGNTDARGTLDVSGASSLKSTLDVTGATDLKSTLDVSGAAAMKSTLDVSGASTLQSTLFVGGNTDARGTLDVSGASTLKGAVTAQDNVSFSGATALFDVSGATTLNTLTVTGVTTVADLNITSLRTNTINPVAPGDTLNLTTEGLINYSGDEFRFLGTSAYRFGIATSDQSIYFQVQDDQILNLVGATTSVGINTTSPLHRLHVGEGDLNLDNTYKYLINSVPVLSQTGLGTTVTSSSLTQLGTLTSLDVSGATTLNTLTATGATSLTSTLDVSGATTLKSSLDVSGDTILRGNVDMSGNSTIAGTLDVTQAATFSNTVTASGNVTFEQNLDVSGNTSLEGTLDVSGATTLESSLDVSGNASLGGTLDVSGTATFSSAVTVNGATTLTQTLDVSGNTSLGGTLDVSGATTLNSSLDVSGATTIYSSFSSVSTTAPFTVAGPTTFFGTVDFQGGKTLASLTLEGDIDMSGNDINNVNDIRNGTTTRITLDASANTIDTYVGTGTTALVSYGEGSVTVNGDLQVIGSQTEVTIQSETVQIADINITLAYDVSGSNKALINGAGITIGGANATFLKPHLVFDSTIASPTGAWTSNIPMVFTETGATHVAKIGTDGIFTSTSTANTSLFMALESNALSFSDKWRFRHETANGADKLVMEYKNGANEWVPKFEYNS